ncbi:sensor histidine kinase [Rhizohabitans arisaemae]|uniref:sensor histidine kinase n=1 Tax=Rhizohabitans arisaemae TaxID=2720610 RepID=UPI0024B1A367|nr:sensor histidine kinase [Rhizohabitans arisaemae]
MAKADKDHQYVKGTIRYDPDLICQAVLIEYERHLAATGSPVLTDAGIQEQLKIQASLVTKDVLARWWNLDLDDRTSLPLSMEIGAKRAQAGVHPTQSLHAAALMFEAAFPVLAQRLVAEDDHPVEGVLTIGLELHRSIMVRLAVGSVPYVNFLLGKLLSAYQDERHRIARDLHDRIAHGMGVALQQLDLYEVYRDDDPERAANNLATARQAIREGLQGTRQLSADLWEKVGDDSLEVALRKYLRTTVPRSTRVSVDVQGPPISLPWEVTEELYILLREAVRNAMLHSGTTELAVALETADGVLRASVSDHGCGFDVVATQARKKGGGLTSMRERAALLGGTVAVLSNAGEGTTVEVRIPMSDDPILTTWQRREVERGRASGEAGGTSSKRSGP